MDLDLRCVPPTRKDQAVQAYEEGDALGFLMSAEARGDALALVFDNTSPLLEKGIYEEALLHAFTGCRTNWRSWNTVVITWMFSHADRSKLLAAGAPLPPGNSFHLYRGVAGRGRARRLDGFSWTSSLPVACWFATRYSCLSLAHPAVLEATVPREAILACSHDRGEDEFICRPEQRRRMKLTADEIQEKATTFKAD